MAGLQSGMDHCYPASSYRLFQQIRQEHLVLSEYPHDTKPQRYQFPLRNRIIAGISKGVCVIEAKERSGSLITAHTCDDFVISSKVFFNGFRLCGRFHDY